MGGAAPSGGNKLRELTQTANDVRPKISAQRYEQLQDFNSITRRLHSYRQRNLRGLMTELRDQIPDRPIRAFEIGCAAGRTYGMLAPDFPLDYVGIDFRRDRVELAQERYADRPARFLHGDATDKSLYQPDCSRHRLRPGDAGACSRRSRRPHRRDRLPRRRPRLFVVSVPVEIGPTVWIKALGSRIMGYDRGAGYNAADLFGPDWANSTECVRTSTTIGASTGAGWSKRSATTRTCARPVRCRLLGCRAASPPTSCSSPSPTLAEEANCRVPFAVSSRRRLSSGDLKGVVRTI